VVLGRGRARGRGRGGAPGAPAGREGVHLPPCQERPERRRRSGGSPADGPAAAGMDRPTRGPRATGDHQVPAQAGEAAHQLQGPGARRAGQARHHGDPFRLVRDRWAGMAGQPQTAAALCREGHLAAPAHRRAHRRDRHAHRRDQRPARRRPRLPGDPAAARHRPSPCRGHRRRDRRHHPVPQCRAAVLVGRADTTPPRVRPEGRPRPCHQARIADAALGADRGDSAHPGRHSGRPAQGRHHRPPRQASPQHRQGRRRPRCGHPVHLRRAAGVRTAPGVGQRLRAAHRLLRAHHRLPGRLRAGHPRRYRPHLPAAGGFAGHTPGSVGPAWQPRNLRNPTTVAHPCSGCGPETRRTAGRTGRARSGLGTPCHATGNTGRTSRHRACGRTSA
jgi:hypothetical protein